jgi:hypothetical protein
VRFMSPEIALSGGSGCLLFRRCQGTSRHPANESRPPLLTLLAEVSSGSSVSSRGVSTARCRTGARKRRLS